MANSNNIKLLGGGVNPVGTIISFMGNNAPEGYLKCDGTVYNIADYQALADHFENEFGTKNNFGGDGTDTFAVPDLQGEFLRGAGTNSHTNQGSGANVGEHQNGTRIPQYQAFYSTGNKTIAQFYASSGATASQGNVPTYVDSRIMSYSGDIRACNILETALSTSGQSTLSADGYSTRPTNTSILYCIKY